MALFDNNPLYNNISSLTNPVTSGLGGLFDGMSVFGTSIPTGVLGTGEEDKLRKQALLQGLLGTAATYLATPKNLNTGSALPYLGKAFLGGMGASQDVVDKAVRAKLLAGRDDNLYNVDGALVDKSGKVIYQSPTKQQKRDTAVVDGVVVDVNTGEAVYTSPKQQKLNTDVIDVGGKKILINKDTGEAIQEYKTTTQPKEIKYTIQNDASGQAVYVPDTPGAQALDMQGRPITYKPALSPDQAKRQEKLEKAKEIPDLLKEAESLLPKATGSGLGAARDVVAAIGGKSTKGAQNLASLKYIQSQLILKMPRLEGPQGVLDLKLYESAAADIGNPYVPAETKKAALDTIKRLSTKYDINETPNQPTQQTNVQAPASGFKEGAKTKSKSGKPMIFRNGQWEYE
jgi:hypothetical protein